MRDYDYENEVAASIQSIIDELMRERDHLQARVDAIRDALGYDDYQWLVAQGIISQAAGDYLAAVAQSHAEDQAHHRVAPLGDA